MNWRLRFEIFEHEQVKTKPDKTHTKRVQNKNVQLILTAARSGLRRKSQKSSRLSADADKAALDPLEFSLTENDAATPFNCLLSTKHLLQCLAACLQRSPHWHPHSTASFLSCKRRSTTSASLCLMECKMQIRFFECEVLMSELPVSIR